MKKKSVIKLLSLSLCGALAATSITTFVRADGNGTSDTSVPSGVSVLETTLSGASLLTSDTNGNKASKDETVYVLTNADGSVQKVIVSDWLKNALGETALKDVSNLKNIENVKGDETFVTDQGNTYWNSQGKDVYYQGNSDQSLPVSVSVTYLLDGKAVTPEELKGKSGHVTIRYTYQNTQYQLMEVDGKEEKIFVPFAMLTGLLLDNDIFTNVEVTGGRLINDGNRTIVAGVTFPGLQKNLKLDAGKFEIPDCLEIQADVTDFKLGTSVTIATNEIFNHLNLDGVGSMEELQNAMTQLSDGMSQLMDGSSQLTDGLKELLEKSGEMSDGVTKLADGAKELANGAGSLNDGAAQLLGGAQQLQGGATQLHDGAAKLQNGVSQLQGGARQLSAGLDTLVSNNDSLNGGARQVFETLLATAQSQLNANGLSVPAMTIENYGDALNSIISSLDNDAVYAQALQAVTDAVNAQSDLITEKVTAAVRAQVESGVTEAVRAQVEAQVTEAVKAQVPEQTPEETVQALIVSNTDARMDTDEVKAIITANIDAKMAEDSIQATIAQNVEAQKQKAITDNMASPAVQEKLAAASEGAKAVISLKASLDNYNTFYLGLQAYTAGVAQAATGASQLCTGASELTAGAGQLTSGAGQLSSGAGQLTAGVGSLKDGTQKLYEGAGQLSGGLAELQNSMPALLDGVSKLYDGSAALKDGLETFNEEGIEKLVNAIDGDLEGLVNRLQATVNASKQYRNFSGISEDMDGQVKFIYRIDGIE
ncbi:MAG: hypothetical protein IK081_09160 [Lachnospiraceae bacterium]|nr:hypothetical protein [Lachnospiraceae bacterium]